MSNTYNGLTMSEIFIEAENGFLTASMEIKKDETVEISRQEGSESPTITFDSWDE